MAEENIRLQYSGFLIFAAKVASVITGLIFQFIVARALSDAEYGLWFNINDINGYFVLLAGVLPFWTMRFVARGKKGAIKTGLVTNLIISLIATLIYVPLVPLITSALHINAAYVSVYFLISIQIIEQYSIFMMEACLQARAPQKIGYGLLVQQLLKIALAYILIVMFNQLLLGAVVSTLAAFALQIAYYVKLLGKELKQRIEWEYVKSWLKGSLANIYNVAGNQIAAYIFIMLFAFGSESGRGIYGAAATVVNVITYASFLAYALYPKLLADRNSEDITTSLKMVLMFAVPMAFGAIALSDSYMGLLKPEWAYAFPVLVVLAIDAFFTAVSGVFSYILYGVENVDEGARLSLHELVRSRLFIAFSLPYLHFSITLPTAFFVLTNYAQGNAYLAALYVTIINSSVRFAMILVQFAIVRKMIKIEFPWRTIAKYVLAAAAMGTVLYLIPHPTRVSFILLETAVGALAYIGLLLAIDKEARRLFTDIIAEVKGKLNRK